MSKHTPTPWYLEKFDTQEENRVFRLYGDKKTSGCGYRIMDIAFHENSPLGQDMVHAVKCVNEHEVLQAQIAELVEALEELSDLMEGVIEGDYKPDSFALQPARRVLAKHTKGGE